MTPCITANRLPLRYKQYYTVKNTEFFSAQNIDSLTENCSNKY